MLGKCLDVAFQRELHCLHASLFFRSVPPKECLALPALHLSVRRCGPRLLLDHHHLNQLLLQLSCQLLMVPRLFDMVALKRQFGLLLPSLINLLWLLAAHHHHALQLQRLHQHQLVIKHGNNVLHLQHQHPLRHRSKHPARLVLSLPSASAASLVTCARCTHRQI